MGLIVRADGTVEERGRRVEATLQFQNELPGRQFGRQGGRQEACFRAENELDLDVLRSRYHLKFVILKEVIGNLSQV